MTFILFALIFLNIIPIMSSQMELEKLIAMGKDLDLKGINLQEWVNEQRDILKRERDEERTMRLKQRDIDSQIRESEQEDRLRQLELQKEIEEIKKATAEAMAQSGNHGGNAHVKSRAPKLPPFRQDIDDIDSYISRFERYALSQGWDKNTEWANCLAALIQGNGLF